MSIQMRVMVAGDMPDVLEIEKHGPAPHWDKQDFRGMFKQRNCVAKVAVSDAGKSPEIVGFVVYLLDVGSITVANLCVHEDHRQLGVGRAMLTSLIEKLDRGKRTSLFVQAHELNVAAQRFLRACGFSSETLVRGAYDEGESDGIRFALRLVDRKLFKNRISSLLKE